MPAPAELRNRPQDGILWIQKVAAVELGFFSPFLIVWGYVDIYRRKDYVGGPTGGPGGWRARLVGVGAPPTSWPPVFFLDVGSKSLGSCLLIKSCSRRFHSVWTPFDIPFLRNPKTSRKRQFWAGPPVNRLVPKII